MSNEDDWLAQLRQVYEMDRARQEAKENRQAEGEPEVTAEQLLKRCKAHELMRQVQKTLLDGEGRLQFYEDVGGYERAVVLMWKGPISDASKPSSIEDVEGSIIVDATDDGIFVNDNELSEVSPEDLRRALPELAPSLRKSKGDFSLERDRTKTGQVAGESSLRTMCRALYREFHRYAPRGG